MTATLDESTLSHLGVEGKIMATAPGDIGRGAKAAAHDIKKGHPIADGKAMGKGVGRAGPVRKIHHKPLLSKGRRRLLGRRTTRW